MIPPGCEPEFCHIWNLPWDFYFNKVHSMTPLMISRLLAPYCWEYWMSWRVPCMHQIYVNALIIYAPHLSATYSWWDYFVG